MERAARFAHNDTAEAKLDKLDAMRIRWPAAPAQTFLRTLGIEIVFGREGRLGTRTIRITAMGENRTHDTVSTVSRVSDYGDRAGLNHPPPGLEQAL
jgi:hypothetical protein